VLLLEKFDKIMNEFTEVEAHRYLPQLLTEYLSLIMCTCDEIYYFLPPV
jgi:hypothetical protein